MFLTNKFSPNGDTFLKIEENSLPIKSFEKNLERKVSAFFFGLSASASASATFFSERERGARAQLCH
jgi:hypothetical protein